MSHAELSVWHEQAYSAGKRRPVPCGIFLASWKLITEFFEPRLLRQQPSFLSKAATIFSHPARQHSFFDFLWISGGLFEIFCCPRQFLFGYFHSLDKENWFFPCDKVKNFIMKNFQPF